MSFTGDFLSAEQALRAGLVTTVVQHDALLPEARRVAAAIVGNDRATVRALLATYRRIEASGEAGSSWQEPGSPSSRPTGSEPAVP